MKRAVVFVVVWLAVLYFGDAALVRVRSGALVTMDRQVYYAIGLKGNKTEYERGGVETDTCTRSLFPQMGHEPCWYMMKHPTKWVSLGADGPEGY